MSICRRLKKNECYCGYLYNIQNCYYKKGEKERLLLGKIKDHIKSSHHQWFINHKLRYDKIMKNFINTIKRKKPNQSLVSIVKQFAEYSKNNKIKYLEKKKKEIEDSIINRTIEIDGKKYICHYSFDD